MANIHTFPAPLTDDTRFSQASERQRIQALARLVRAAQKAGARAALFRHSGETARQTAADAAALRRLSSY